MFREHLVKLATTLDALLPGPRRRSLDIACNDGSLVEEMRRLGVWAQGIDPCAPDEQGYYRAFFNEEWAKANRPGFAFKPPKSQNVQVWLWSVITALNVFAHVDDLDDFTRGVHTLLEPCGLFVIECAYLPDMIRQGVFCTVYHEHLGFHHLAPLVPFFERHGMRIVDAHRVDSQGGSVRIYVRNCTSQHVGGDDGHNLQSERLKRLLAEETNQGIWPGVRALKDSVASERKWLLSFARHHKLTGKPIAIYGAPAKLTTYMHATGLFPERVGLVCDDNPRKIGKYVPGTRLLIEPTSKLREYQPSGILCASWNFASDIRARHADIGAEWYVPYEARQPSICPRGHDLDEKSECAECGLKVSYKSHVA